MHLSSIWLIKCFWAASVCLCPLLWHLIVWEFLDAVKFQIVVCVLKFLIFQFSLNFSVFFLAAPPQTTPVQMEGSCPENTYSFKWFPYGEYCYGVTTTSSSWEPAQTGCQNAVPSRPCNLVSIHDPLESKFVGDILVQVVPYVDAFWIGLSKASFG